MTSSEQPQLEIPNQRQIDLVNQNGYLFSNINQANDLIVREHFNNLASFTPSIEPTNFTRAFNSLINCGNKHRVTSWSKNPATGEDWTQIDEPTPRPGIILVKRSDIGFGAYQSLKRLTTSEDIVLARYGMLAGSVLQAINNMDLLPKQRTTDDTIRRIGELLSKQLATS